MVKLNCKPEVYQGLVMILDNFVKEAQGKGEIRNSRDITFKGISIENDQYQEKFRVNMGHIEITKFRQALEDDKNQYSELDINLDHADVKYPFTNQDLFDEEKIKKRVAREEVPPKRYKGYQPMGEWMVYESGKSLVKITNRNIRSLERASN